jgi:curli biogenesis system outer membrane secretion channel CsgG
MKKNERREVVEIMVTTIKKTFCCFLLAVFVLIFIPQLVSAAEPGSMRYTISVAKFENRSGWSGRWDIGDAWGMVLTDILNQTERFTVLGETDMRRDAINEQNLANSGRTVQGAKTPIYGQMTPAQILIKGAITHVQDTSSNMGGISFDGILLGGRKSTSEVNVTMYMVDTSTGQVIASISVVGKSDRSGVILGYSGAGWSGGYGNFQKSNLNKAIESAVSQGVQWMITQLPKISWYGTVIMNEDGNIYINRGLREGVKSGQIFSVGKVNIIRDPDTGEVLDESVQEIGRIQVVTIKDRITICQVISGNTDAMTKGMRVQLP